MARAVYFDCAEILDSDTLTHIGLLRALRLVERCGVVYS